MRIVVLIIGTLASQLALAHHAMGSQTPSTLFEGLVSGLAHPVIGLDHLAFIVGAGLLAAAYPQRRWLPLAFVAATVAGTGLHLMLFDLPYTELAVALSVLALGGLLAAGRRPGAALVAGLFALSGLFHGYAYGEAVIGAEATPVAAYLLGFALIQYALCLTAMTAAQRLGTAAARGAGTPWVRSAGLAVALTGALFVLPQLVG